MNRATPEVNPTSLGARLLASLLSLSLSACGANAPEETSSSAERLTSRQSALSSTPLRVVAANLATGSSMNYDSGHGIRILQGTGADVVLIQEFRYGDRSPAAIRQFVDAAFGTDFQYYRDTNSELSTGIISRYPILASGEWVDPNSPNRDFSWARIDIPGPKDLWAVSVHLLSSGGSMRNTQSTTLVQYIQANVPAEDFLVIGGSLSTDSLTESSFATLAQVVSTSGPHPVDQNGNGNTNAGRTRPYDHVLVDGELLPYQTATVMGASTFPSGLVMDTRVYSPISEIAPAEVGDSAATNMRHMAVIKDFLIPVESVEVTAPNGGERWEIGSSQTITWRARFVANVKLEYTLDGSTWNVITSSIPATAGSYAWVVPGPVSGAAKVRVTDADNGSRIDESDVAFTISGTPRVFINEVLANEPGSDTSREFIEVVNTGTAEADLSGWTLSDAAGVRHTFASGTSLPVGKAIAVFGAAVGIPSGVTHGVASTTGTLSLNNAGDTVTLKDASSTAVDAVTYGSSLASTDAVSMNRGPDADPSGAFVLHTGLSSLLASPGTQANGAAFP